ncbi:hypothetical protein EDD21DRAFT_165319 [Dissophora ornata]|nr:hypothetical protein BGZ58_007823 [Dissophora ornata]KAI8599231.1 hypothetical protein EDD21DRAFT_165319 [Dissophora ornata]
MSIILPQTPIEVRNPYSVLLESEYNSHITTNTADNAPTFNLTSRAMLTRAVSDDDLDRISVSSWSVVNSAYASDSEEDDDEIYIDASAAQLAPLTVSALSEDGFTNISKTMTAASINSSSVATAQPDVWVVKISKKRQHSSTPLRKSASVKIPKSTAPSLEDVIEGESESDDQVEETMSFTSSDLTGGDLYMSMTEHELSKSAKAVKLKNVRLAIAHDTELSRALKLPLKHQKTAKVPKTTLVKVRNEKTRVRSVALD